MLLLLRPAFNVSPSIVDFPVLLLSLLIALLVGRDVDEERKGGIDVFSLLNMEGDHVICTEESSCACISS